MYRLIACFLKKPLLLAIGILLSFHAFSWGLTGHRTIAEIAERHLTKKAKKEITKLIGRESLAWWANWPDFIKSDTTWRHASPWHYVDLPGNMQKDDFISALKKLPGENLYTQIQAMVAQLRDKTLPVEKRRIALSFLIHLAGDLHQPLHVGREEDQGGNKITVYWFNEKTNLHSLWDTKLIDFQQYSYTEYAKLLDIAKPEQIKEWQSSSLEDWFYESHVLSDSIYNASPAEAKLGYNYNFQFQDILNQQLLKGGIRLAAMINKAFE
jgi:hypothetical protein